MAKENRNPFKEMEGALLEAPTHMKKKVMNDIAAAKLILEMSALFTCNYKSTIEEMFNTKPEINF